MRCGPSPGYLRERRSGGEKARVMAPCLLARKGKFNQRLRRCRFECHGENFDVSWRSFLRRRAGAAGDGIALLTSKAGFALPLATRRSFISVSHERLSAATADQASWDGVDPLAQRQSASTTTYSPAATMCSVSTMRNFVSAAGRWFLIHLARAETNRFLGARDQRASDISRIPLKRHSV
jgi:hypothetical protein